MKCLQCGAGLEYVQNVRYARCSHCLALFNVVEQNHQRFLQPIQVPPEQLEAYGIQLGFAPRKASHSVVGVGGVNVVLATGKMERDIKNKISGWIWGLVIGGIIILLMAVLLVVVLVFVVRAKSDMDESNNPTAENAKAATWDGKSPFTCGGVDNIKLEKVTSKLTTGTAITAMGNCHVTCANCDITAPVVVEASANAQVTFTGGKVDGSTNSAVAGANAKVDFQGTTVKGPTKATAAGKITGAK